MSELFPECPADEDELRLERFRVLADYDRKILFAREESTRAKFQEERCRYLHNWTNRLDAVRQRMSGAARSAR